MTEVVELTNATTTDIVDSCYYERPALIHIKFWMVAVCGTTISALSTIENSILFVVFVRNRHHRNSPALYLLLLAFFDIFMSISYVMLMSVNVLVDYYELIWLYRLWMYYSIPMLTISHIAMTSSTYLILAATIERYCITVSPKYLRFISVHRHHIAISAVLLGTITKGTIVGELWITVNADCPNSMSELMLVYSDWFPHTKPIGIFWKFWFRTFATIFVPFFLLTYFNFRIVFALTRNGTVEFVNEEQLSKAQRKARIRAASRTLVLVVCTYLIANILSVIITFWEQLDLESLQGSNIYFFTLSNDLISLLSIWACTTRLPIYAACQPTIRKELINTLLPLISIRRKRSTRVFRDDARRRHMDEQQRIEQIDNAAIINEAADDDRNRHQPAYAALMMNIGTAFSVSAQDDRRVTNSNVAYNSSPSIGDDDDEHDEHYHLLLLNGPDGAKETTNNGASRVRWHSVMISQC